MHLPARRRLVRHRWRAGFHSAGLEVLALITIYALYLSFAFAAAKRLAPVTGLSIASLVLAPIALCHILAIIWGLIRRCRGSRQTLPMQFAIGSLLLLGLTIIGIATVLILLLITWLRG